MAYSRQLRVPKRHRAIANRDGPFHDVANHAPAGSANPLFFAQRQNCSQVQCSDPEIVSQSIDCRCDEQVKGPLFELNFNLNINRSSAEPEDGDDLVRFEQTLMNFSTANLFFVHTHETLGTNFRQLKILVPCSHKSISHTTTIYEESRSRLSLTLQYKTTTPNHPPQQAGLSEVVHWIVIFFGAISGVVRGKVTVKTPSTIDALISSGCTDHGQPHPYVQEVRNSITYLDALRERQ